MTSPGSICIVANGTDWRAVTPDACHVIASLDSLAVAVPPPERLFGVYASGNTTTQDVTAEVKRARELNVRPCVCWDDWSPYPAGLLAQLPMWGIPLLEYYQTPRQQPLETLDEAIVRWGDNTNQLSHLWPHDFGVVFQDYLGGTTLDRVLAGQAPSVRLVNAQIACKIITMFAWDRSNGGWIPALAETMRAVAAASPGTPTLIPVPPIPPPDVADSRLLYSLIERRTSHMTATRVVGGPMLKASGGGYGVILNNPIDQDYLGLPPKNTVLQGGPDSGQVVLTVTPSGDFQCRDKNAIGSWETGMPSGGFLVYTGDGGQRFLIPFAK